MPLTKCKECKQDVSSSAEICPHCGVKYPGMTLKDYVIGFMILIAAVFAFVKIMGVIDEEKRADRIANNSQIEKVNHAVQRKTLSDADRINLEQQWTAELQQYSDLLTTIFEKAKRSNQSHQYFTEQKTHHWHPQYSAKSDAQGKLFKKYGMSRLLPKLDRVRRLHRAFVDLDLLSIEMQKYLQGRDQKDLDTIQYLTEETIKVLKND